MKNYLFFLFLVIPCWCMAQIGLKAGFNFANVTKTSSLNNSNRSGYHLGIFIASPYNRIIGFSTELLYSRQGYNFKSNTNTGNVNLDYIMFPQYMSINITKFVSVLFGGQISYLLNAGVDSTGTSGNQAADDILKYYKRLDFGYGGGAEIHPVTGLIIGARFNISLGNLFSDLSDPSNSNPPSFIPKVNVKNNLFQIYTGWKFGK